MRDIYRNGGVVRLCLKGQTPRLPPRPSPVSLNKGGNRDVRDLVDLIGAAKVGSPLSGLMMETLR